MYSNSGFEILKNDFNFMSKNNEDNILDDNSYSFFQNPFNDFCNSPLNSQNNLEIDENIDNNNNIDEKNYENEKEDENIDKDYNNKENSLENWTLNKDIDSIKVENNKTSISFKNNNNNTENIDNNENKDIMLLNKKVQRKKNKTPEEKELQKQIRKEKNKISAQKSRDKKNNELNELREVKIKLLEEISRLKLIIEQKDQIIAKLKSDTSTNNNISSNVSQNENIYIEQNDYLSTYRNSNNNNNNNSSIYLISALSVFCIIMLFINSNKYMTKSNYTNNMFNKNNIRQLYSESGNLLQIGYENNMSNINYTANKNNINNNSNLNFLFNKTINYLGYDKTEKTIKKESFIEKALYGNSINTKRITSSNKIEKKINNTDIVPYNYFQNNFIKILKPTYISLFYNNNSLQMKNISDLEEKLNELLQYNGFHNRKLRFINFDNYYIYMSFLVPSENDNFYEIGCKVTEFKKLLINQ